MVADVEAIAFDFGGDTQPEDELGYIGGHCGADACPSYRYNYCLDLDPDLARDNKIIAARPAKGR